MINQAEINNVELFDIKVDKARNLKIALNLENYNFKIRELSLEGIKYCLLKDLEIGNTTLISWKCFNYLC